jgi:hypothetical protein
MRVHFTKKERRQRDALRVKSSLSFANTSDVAMLDRDDDNHSTLYYRDVIDMRRDELNDY